MRHKIYGLAIFFLAIFFSGCYPAGPEYTDEFDIVFTNYDKDCNFASKKYFAIPDKVVMVDGKLQTGQNPSFLNNYYGNIIIERIKSNMISRGYLEVQDTTIADLIIFPGAMQVTTVSYTAWYDYWDYYYGYGWYYPYTMVNEYTTGTLAMLMIDRKNLNPSNRARVVWTGLVNGLMEGPSTNFEQRIKRTIDQSFAQSTYLNH
jgi:hypothetical protein